LRFTTGMPAKEINQLEKDVNANLLYWVVQNEHLRRYTGQPHRLFTYRHPDTIEVNLNWIRHDYLVKFVKADEMLYLTELLKRIEPVMFKIMSLHGLSEYTFTYHFFIEVRIRSKEVSHLVRSLKQTNLWMVNRGCVHDIPSAKRKKIY
jgi:hypothetical protein